MPPAGLEIYARLCAWTLARAHARSGDAVAIGAYLGGGESFDEALAEFSRLYADQNERDYEAVREAIDSGRLAGRGRLTPDRLRAWRSGGSSEFWAQPSS